MTCGGAPGEINEEGKINEAAAARSLARAPGDFEG